MASLTTAAIIVIVIVACLALVSLGAALTKHLNPSRLHERYNYSREQELYMRSIRLKNLGDFHQQSMGRDLESGYGGDSPRYWNTARQ